MTILHLRRSYDNLPRRWIESSVLKTNGPRANIPAVRGLRPTATRFPAPGTNLMRERGEETRCSSDLRVVPTPRETDPLGPAFSSTCTSHTPVDGGIGLVIVPDCSIASFARRDEADMVRVSDHA